jgi:hypothetical protein
MRRLIGGLACAFFCVFQANAVPEANFSKSKLVTLKDREQNVVDVDLRFSNSQLLVMKRGKSEVLMQIPYNSIRSISYEYAERHRIEEALVLPTPIMLTKNRSHWLAVSHDQGIVTVFRLHKDEFMDIISTFEAKTGKSVELRGDKGGLANPTAGSKNVDQIVPYRVEKIFPELKPAMEKYNCYIKKEQPEKKGKTTVVCKRPATVSGWKPGADAGPTGIGHEKVTVILENLGEQTRVKVETGKGINGRFRKRNWSTPIFKEIMNRLEHKAES